MATDYTDPDSYSDPDTDLDLDLDLDSLNDRLHGRSALGVLLDQALPLGDQSPGGWRLLGRQVAQLRQGHCRTHAVSIRGASAVGQVRGGIQAAISRWLVDDLWLVSVP